MHNNDKNQSFLCLDLHAPGLATRGYNYTGFWVLRLVLPRIHYVTIYTPGLNLTIYD